MVDQVFYRANGTDAIVTDTPGVVKKYVSHFLAIGLPAVSAGNYVLVTDLLRFDPSSSTRETYLTKDMLVSGGRLKVFVDCRSNAPDNDTQVRVAVGALNQGSSEAFEYGERIFGGAGDHDFVDEIELPRNFVVPKGFGLFVVMQYSHSASSGSGYSSGCNVVVEGDVFFPRDLENEN